MESISNHLVATLPFPVMVLDQTRIWDEVYGRIFGSVVEEGASTEFPWQEIQA
jgi:hypothetical protein